MARSPDDPYFRATDFGRRVYDSADNGVKYDHDWLKSELDKHAAGAAEPAAADTYKPIDTSPYPALDFAPAGAAAPGTPERPDSGLLSALRGVSRTTTPSSDGVSLLDQLKNVGAGTMEMAGALTGAAEYATRQASPQLGVYSDALTSVRQGAYDVAGDLTASMSPEAQERLVRQWLTLDPGKTLWQGGPMEAVSAIGLKFSRALPSTVATLLPAARLFRAGMTPGAITYLGASEGTLSMGGIATGIAQEIEQMTPEELAAESQRYQQLTQGGLDPEAARQQLITEAQGAAPLIGGVLVGAISVAAGRYLEPVFAKGGSMGQRFAGGFAAEAPQEAGQSAAEQFVQNVAAQIYDAERAPLAGVAEAAVEGGAIGGLTGGGFSAAVGRQAQPAQAPNPQPVVEPAAAPRQALGFETVFGTGGRQPSPQGEAFGDVMGDDGITPEQRVALNIRADNMMEELPLGEPYNPVVDPVRGDPAEIAMRNEQLDLQRPYDAYKGRGGSLLDVLRAQGQQDLPLARRERGYRSADIPSAEPRADIEAQLLDLQDPQSQRQGVYLSAANLQQLGDDVPNLVTGMGVPLENFDGEGGMLVARDRVTANTLTRMRDGGADMQAVLGRATGAGTGKPPPAAGQLAVQRLNAQGNVLQESLVGSQEEAEQLAAGWPNSRILPPEEAIARREELIRREEELRRSPDLSQGDLFRQGRTAAVMDPDTVAKPTRGEQLKAKADQARSVRRQAAKLEGRVPEEVIQSASEAKTPTKAAARVLGAATRQAAKEEQRRIGGFYPPDALEFDQPEHEERYRGTFDELVTEELKGFGGAGTDSTRRTELLDQLGKLRQISRPRRRAARTVEAAGELSQRTVKASKRELEQKAETVLPPEKDLLGDLESLTDEQVDALEGDKLEETFHRTARHLAGRSRHVMLSYEGGEAGRPPEAIAEGEEQVAVMARPVLTLSKILESYGDKKKVLIRRVQAAMRRRAHGGKSAASVLTRRAAQGETTGASVPRRTAKFDTSVLTRMTSKKDESRADRFKRQGEVERARSALTKTIAKVAERIEAFSTGEFASYAQERSAKTGDLTQGARDMLVGRMYFRTVADFGAALAKSGNDSAAALAEMNKVDEFLLNAIAMEPATFAKTMANLARAEVQEQIKSIPVGDATSRAIKAKLMDPETRAQWTADTNDKLRQHAAWFTRLNEVWKTDSYYRSIVGPLMFKFADSTWRDGWPSYKPTEKELQALQFALRLWHNTSKEDTLYQPVRRWFGAQGLGFEFTESGDLVIPRDANGNYEYHPTDSMLQPLYRDQFGGEADIGQDPSTREQIPITELEFGERPEDGGPRPLVEKTSLKSARVVPIPRTPRVLSLRDREVLATRADKFADIEKWGRVAQLNRIIDAFRKRVSNSKTTVPGLIRAEERLIRVMKSLGVWQATPSPKIGKIKTALGERTYRLVGSRLIAGQLEKEDARRLMLRINPLPLPAVMADHPGVQQRAAKMVDAEMEFFLKEIGPQDNIDAFRAVGEEISRRLSSDFNANVKLHDLLQGLVVSLPDTHLYHQTAARLLALPNTNLPTGWNYGQKMGIENLGRTIFEGRQEIILNRRAMNDNWREKGREPAAALLHTILHEGVHVATMHAVRTKPRVYAAVKALQTLTRRHLIANGQEESYGTRDTDDPSEFVAEAFSNVKFQGLLKRVRVEKTTVWQKFKMLVREIFGVESQAANAFDAIMELAPELFSSTQWVPTRGAVAVANLNETVAPLVGSVIDRSKQTMGALETVWDKARSFGAPLSAMTMEQLRDTYAHHFGDGKNSMWRYMSAFFQRNAENSRLMEEAEKLSRHWTALTEEEGGDEHAIEFSRLGTEATLAQAHIDLDVLHKSNNHLTSTAAKQRHAELARRFQALPDAWRKHYTEVRRYYAESLKLEVALMAQNALRGVLARGNDATMTPEQFDRKYTVEKVITLNTKEAFKAEFPDLAPNLAASLLEIASIPSIRKGPYFPLMRYGEFVVSASRVVETKTVADLKAAREFAASKRADDPTLDFSFDEHDKGVTVTVHEKDFRVRESKTEIEEQRQEMIALYGAAAVSTVQLKADYAQQATIQSGSALATIIDKLEGNSAAVAAIKNFYLRSLADSSFRKHEIARKNRKGVDFDLQHRNFTNYAKQSAYYTAQLQYGWKMADSLADMQKFITSHRDESEITTVRLGQIRGEIKKRDEMSTDVEETPKHIRRGSELSQFMLLFSPSYWMINATQPYMVALPWLAARSSWGAAGAAMTHAQKLIMSPLVTATKDSWGGIKAVTSKAAAEKAFGVLEQVKEQIRARGGDRADNYITMLEALRRESIVDMSWITELRDIAEGRDASLTQRVLDATRVMAHLTEVNNRVITALAAYDLKFNEASANEATRDQAHAIGVEFAKAAVSKTMFNYSSGNKPRLFQSKGQLGRYAPWVFQFMQYPQHMYAMLIDGMYQLTKGDPEQRRIARRTLAGIFATHLAAGGIIGASLQPIKWAMGLAMMMLGDDDEPYTFANAMSGATFDKMINEAASTMFGSEIGGVISRGLPTAVGTDLSARMSLGTLYYLDLKTDTSESTLGSLVSGFGGPLVNIGLGWLRGVDYVRQGEYQKAAETLYPKILKDFSRFQRYATDGLVNNSGDTVLPANTLSPWQLFLQSLGFQPEQMSTFYERQAVIQDAKRYGESRKSLLVQRFRSAEPGDRAEILREVAAFNKAYPAEIITRSTLLRAMQGKAEREASFNRFGAALRGRDVLYADEAEYLK